MKSGQLSAYPMKEERDNFSEDYDRMKAAHIEALRERDQAIQKERERLVAYRDRLRAEAHQERSQRAPEFPTAERLEREADAISTVLAALQEDDRG